MRREERQKGLLQKELSHYENVLKQVKQNRPAKCPTNFTKITISKKFSDLLEFEEVQINYLYRRPLKDLLPKLQELAEREAYVEELYDAYLQTSIEVLETNEEFEVRKKKVIAAYEKGEQDYKEMVASLEKYIESLKARIEKL